MAVAGDPLPPVLAVEDQAAGAGVAHDLSRDAVEAGVTDERTLVTIHYVDAPQVCVLLPPDLVEPLVLTLLRGRHLAPEVARDLVALHTTTGNEQRHILSLQRGHLDDEIADRETHDWSEHISLPQFRIRENGFRPHAGLTTG